jgi:hypothetical protein
MATTGPRTASAAVSVADSPWNNNSWVNPSGVYGTGTASVTAATYDAGDRTYSLKLSGFDFSVIPDGSTIDGVQVTVNGSYANAVVSIDLVQLLSATFFRTGTNLGTPAQALTTTFANYIFGGSTSNWGLSLTSDWIKNSNFGVVLGCLAGGSGNSNNDVFLDYVLMEVWYTPPSTAGLAVGGGSVSLHVVP